MNQPVNPVSNQHVPVHSSFLQSSSQPGGLQPGMMSGPTALSSHGPMTDQGPMLNQAPMTSQSSMFDQGPMTVQGPASSLGPMYLTGQGSMLNHAPMTDLNSMSKQAPMSMAGQGSVLNQAPVSVQGPMTSMTSQGNIQPGLEEDDFADFQMASGPSSTHHITSSISGEDRQQDCSAAGVTVFHSIHNF